MNSLRSLLYRFLGSDKKEANAVLLSFGYFFCILFAYFILQPLRDSIGLLLGREATPSLFRWSLLAMIVANPIFSMLVTRMSRRRFMAIAFRFFLANILVFIAAFKWLEYRGILTPSSDGTPIVLEGGYRIIPLIYFVWVGVYNLFSVTIFWGLMADLFKGGRATRVFGFIGAGGTLGQLLSSLLTSKLVYLLGPTNLLFLAALLMEFSVRFMYGLLDNMETRAEEDEVSLAQEEQKKPTPVWGGISAIFRSPYLIGICLYFCLFSFTSSFLYFQKQEIVFDAYHQQADQVSFFAKINLAVSVCTILLQLTITGYVIPALGVLVCLSLLPFYTGLGFLLLGQVPTLSVVAFFEVSRKTVNYAFSKPCREILFTAVSREEKYLSKSFIDTFVYRAGDASASVAFESFKAAYDLGSKGLCYAAVPFTVVWLGVSVWLGARFNRLSENEDS